MNKPKCHECKFKKSIPGNTHIECASPVLVEAKKSPLFMMVSLTHPQIASKALGLSANEHGVASGWCQFPLNFDPVWLEGECRSFKQK